MTLIIFGEFGKESAFVVAVSIVYATLFSDGIDHADDDDDGSVLAVNAEINFK